MIFFLFSKATKKKASFLPICIKFLGDWVELQYIYLLDGEEMVRLIKDFIKYLFGGQPSLRLQRVLSNWRLFLNSFSREEEKLQKDWLEQAIASTPTWWDSPEKYRRIRRRILGSSSSRTRRQSSSSSSYVSSSSYE